MTTWTAPCNEQLAGNSSSANMIRSATPSAWTWPFNTTMCTLYFIASVRTSWIYYHRQGVMRNSDNSSIGGSSWNPLKLINAVLCNTCTIKKRMVYVCFCFLLCQPCFSHPSGKEALEGLCWWSCFQKFRGRQPQARWLTMSRWKLLMNSIRRRYFIVEEANTTTGAQKMYAYIT